MVSHRAKLFLVVLSASTALATACMVGQGATTPMEKNVADQKVATSPQARPAKPIAKANTPGNELAEKKAQRNARKMPSSEVREKRTVTTPVLNIRSKPSLDAPVIGQLTVGTTLLVTIRREWAEIGKGQYVHAKYLVPARKTEVAARK